MEPAEVEAARVSVAVTGQMVVPMETTWVTMTWDVEPCSSVVTAVLTAVLKMVEVEEEVTVTATTGVLTSPETSEETGALGVSVTVTITVSPLGAVLVEGVATTLTVWL